MSISRHGPGDVGIFRERVAVPVPIHDHVLPAHVGGELAEVLHRSVFIATLKVASGA